MVIVSSTLQCNIYPGYMASAPTNWDEIVHQNDLQKSFDTSQDPFPSKSSIEEIMTKTVCMQSCAAVVSKIKEKQAALLKTIKNIVKP